MVLVQFEVVLYCWFGIVLDWFIGVFVKREKMLGFQRKCCQNFVKTLVLVLTIDSVIIIQMK